MQAEPAAQFTDHAKQSKAHWKLMHTPKMLKYNCRSQTVAKTATVDNKREKVITKICFLNK